MSARRLVTLVAVVAVALASAPAVPAFAGGPPPGQGSGWPAGDVCGLAQRADQDAGGMWVLSRANGFDTSGQKLCIRPAANGRPGFTVEDNLRYTGLWQAYPFTGAGCAYYLCSLGTDLPRKVWRLPSWINTSWSWHGPSDGNWNASYDIWFSKHNQIATEDDGAELMIWLRPNPGYSGGQPAYIGGRWYWFVNWRTCDRSGICWNYIQFRFTSPVRSVRDLALMPFIRWCVQHGHLIRWRWWLTSVHAGYEIVSGGKGLTTTWFDVHGVTR